MIYIVRELSKLCMFVVLWAFPILLTKWSGNNLFLFFFALSIFGTAGVFDHYESLEHTEQNNDDDEHQ